MIFLFKKSKLVIDCFTHRPDVFNFSKIDYAHKFYPEWWKQTPKSVINNFYEISTLKKCRGIIDNYKYGAMVPLWSDLAFNVKNKQYQWQFSDFKTNGDTHPPKQWDMYADPTNYGHLKIESPWRINCKSDTKFYWTLPFWNHAIDIPYHVIPGMVEFKYNHGININIMINLQKDFMHTIKAYTPMAHMIPVSDKELVIKHHLISEEEFSNQVANTTLTFMNKYQTHKNNVDKQESKCPFNFLRRNK
jgi:hypothetical protein